MRSRYITFTAVALLGTATGWAQTQTPESQSEQQQKAENRGDTTTGTTVPRQQAQANPGGNDTPTKSMAATCKKMAADKKLTGDAKKQYVKECEEGKKTREGH